MDADCLDEVIKQWFRDKANRGGRTITFPTYSDISLSEQIDEIDEHRKFCEIVVGDKDWRRRRKDLFLRDRHLSVMRAVLTTLRQAHKNEISNRWIEEYESYH